MNIIKTLPHHIPQVLACYRDASLFLHKQGIDQWQNQYPNLESLRQDMQIQGSYVLVDNDDQVLATMALLFEDDPYYEFIKEGAWSFPSPYGVVHRLCVNSKTRHQGYASLLLEYAIDECKIKQMIGCRIDTHPCNYVMQSLIRKHHFVYSGKVYVANHALRFGFERRLLEKD
mgnify:CR=1 FL=1